MFRVQIIDSGSGILDWIPIRFRIQSGSRFWSKIALHLSLGLHKGRPSYMRSRQPSKENIHHFKTWNLWTITLFVGHFALLDPDPDSGSGYTDLIESGSNSDTKHCKKQRDPTDLEHCLTACGKWGKSQGNAIETREDKRGKDNITWIHGWRPVPVTEPSDSKLTAFRWHFKPDKPVSPPPVTVVRYHENYWHLWASEERH